jgi:hypoxanthine phosphoribosyltransferase
MKNLVTAHDHTFQPLIGSREIAAKVKSLARQIRKDYEGKRPLFLCILNGSFIFAADLVRATAIECEVSFLKLASYDGTQTSGKVATVLGLDRDIAGRHVVIVEDIIDSGITMRHLISDLGKMKPASLTLAVLLLKPDALQFPLQVDYLGFEIPNEFVIGYGLDYNGLGRNLSGIYSKV